MKEILLKWIEKPLNNGFCIREESHLFNFSVKLGEFMEHLLRKEIMDKYLDNPKDETIISVLEEKIRESVEDSFPGYETNSEYQYMLFNVLKRFKQTDLIKYHDNNGKYSKYF